MPKITSTNYQNKRRLVVECPMTHTFSLLGDRWRPILLWKVLQGFGTAAELRRQVPLVSRKMLHQELRALATHALVVRSTAIGSRGARYTATARGRSLSPVLRAALAWGKRQGRGEAVPLAAT